MLSRSDCDHGPTAGGSVPSEHVPSVGCLSVGWWSTDDWWLCGVGSALGKASE